MGGFLTSTPFEDTFPSISGPNDSTMQGFTVAVYEIGCAIGALAVIFGGDMFGRRVTVMVGELILIIGAILQASSFSLAQLIVGRIISEQAPLSLSNRILPYDSRYWQWNGRRCVAHLEWRNVSCHKSRSLHHVATQHQHRMFIHVAGIERLLTISTAWYRHCLLG